MNKHTRGIYGEMLRGWCLEWIGNKLHIGKSNTIMAVGTFGISFGQDSLYLKYAVKND